MNDQTTEINKAKVLLKRKIEEVYNHDISTPRDFQWLSEQLNAMGKAISATTLKRFWGYIPENTTPRKATLDALSQLLGYSSYSHFRERMSDGDEEASAPVLGESIHPSSQMSINERLLVTWQPGRKCVIRHLGNGQFVVESSENTRLMPGNTFLCEMIVEGEPLYLDDLVQAARQPTGYVCGKRNGIHFSHIE